MADNFVNVLTSSSEWKAKNYEGALDNCFMKLDDQISKKEYAFDKGTTSCVVLVTKENIYCANAGDSRAIIV